VQEGLAHCEAGRYREAINALEEAWELDRSNPTVAEYLALAYLYEEHPPALAAFNRAEELMRISLEQDGRATVHARHLHRGLQWLTNMDDSCPGRLVISRRGIDFIAEDGHHSFSLVTDGILVAEVAKRRLSKYEGGIQLDAADGTKYPMLVGTQTWAEAQLFVDLARQFTLGG
jgi:tetratricopeptide (TPR) repeat protein